MNQPNIQNNQSCWVVTQRKDYQGFEPMGWNLVVKYPSLNFEANYFWSEDREAQQREHVPQLGNILNPSQVEDMLSQFDETTAVRLLEALTSVNALNNFWLNNTNYLVNSWEGSGALADIWETVLILKDKLDWLTNKQKKQLIDTLTHRNSSR